MLPSPPSEMNYPPTQKRKRTDIEAEEQHDPAFSATNLISNTPCTFEVVSRLLRAHLPLSWLASAGTTLTNDIHPGSLIKGHIPNAEPWDYAVLVARRTPNGGLVAFEKIDDTYFVVHPLQPFVSEKWIQDASIGASPSVGLQMMLHYLPASDPDHKNELRATPDPDHKITLNVTKPRRGAAARLSILSLSGKKEEFVQSPLSEHSVVNMSDKAASADPDQFSPIPLTVAFDNDETPAIEVSVMPTEVQPDMLSPAYLRQRYQDHLYMTKTSLAYYTKGPLSRARARARAQDSSMTPTDLAAFYRDSLLPIKRMDSKYKETIPQLVQKTEQCVETHVVRSTRRTRLGKDGLWPMEHDFVHRWWKARCVKQPTSAWNESQDARDAISSLRMREAQMQMVLMLEALSIETKQKDVIPASTALRETTDVKAESVEHGDSHDADETPKTKPRKQRNLEADLELLADMLCIWHSVGLEGSIAIGKEVSNKDEDQAESKDRLRNFCMDVLIPFYSSRLPLLCKSLCKTLAGPEIYEQAQKAARLKDAGKESAPGTSVRRRPLSATGRELERVVSGESVRHASPPALTRSATLPPLPKFQREASELSQRPPSRSSRQASISFINREIDLVADAQATASKKRKLERVASHKQDLAAAIEALKKPNRRTVSNAYMDEVERRNPEIVPDAVQIAATPKVNRRSRMDDSRVNLLAQPVFNNDQAIPSSGVKSKSMGTASNIPRSSSKKKAVLAAIHDTPSKGANSKAEPWRELRSPAAGDDHSRVTVGKIPYVLSTPSKPRSRETSLSTKIKRKSPLDSSSEQAKSFTLPDVALKAMDRAMTMPMTSTIYDTLGWNDDDDDDE